MSRWVVGVVVGMATLVGVPASGGAFFGTRAPNFNGQRFSLVIPGVQVRSVASVHLNSIGAGSDTIPDVVIATNDSVWFAISNAVTGGFDPPFKPTNLGIGSDVRAVVRCDCRTSQQNVWVAIEVKPGGGMRGHFFYVEGPVASMGTQDFGGTGIPLIATAGAFHATPLIDAEEDVAVVADDKLYVLLGGNPITLGTTLTLSASGYRPIGVDYDGDGDHDLAIALPTRMEIGAYQSDGNGNLVAGTPLSLSVTPRGISSGNTNGDSLGDVVIAGADGRVRVATSSGSTWSVTTVLPEPVPGRSVYEIAMTDVRGTPQPEFVVGTDGYMAFGEDLGAGYNYSSFWTGGGPPPHQQIVLTTAPESNIVGGGGNRVDVWRQNGGGQYLSGGYLRAGRGAGLGQGADVITVSPNGVVELPPYFAYSFADFGTNVSVGQIRTDTVASQDPTETLTGPGPGPVHGPQVRAFGYDGAPISKVNYYAYGTLKYGVNVSTCNLDGDYWDEILTGPGPGPQFGPHTRGWNYDGSTLTAISKVNFFAFSTLKFGVNVAGGSIDQDLFGEIVTGAGPGVVFAAQVKGFNYDNTTVTPINKVNFVAFPTIKYGANVSLGDDDADSIKEIVASPGPGGTAAYPAWFRGFNYDGLALAGMPGFDFVPAALVSQYGGRSAGIIADASTNGGAEALAAVSGEDPTQPARIVGYDYTGSAMSGNGIDFVVFSSSAYGCKVAGGPFAW